MLAIKCWGLVGTWAYLTHRQPSAVGTRMIHDASLLSSVLQLSGVQRLSCSRAPPPPSPSLPRAPLSAAATKTPPIDRSGVAQRPRGAPTRIGSTGSVSRLLLTHSCTRSLSAAALRAPALGALHTPPPSAPMAPETLTLPINPRCSGVHRATRRSTSAPLRCTAKTPTHAPPLPDS